MHPALKEDTTNAVALALRLQQRRLRTARSNELQLMMVFAEHETRVVSARTKAALQAAKANGKVLGCRTLG